MAIFTAIATAIFGGATLFGASLATIAASGLAFAAQLGFQYLNRPKKRKYTAIQGETQYGGDVAVGTLLGTGKTKGQRSFYAKAGRGNKYNMEVFLLANGWCDGLEPYVYFYGAKHNLVPTVFPGNHVAAFFVEGFGDKILLLFFDGRPGQGVDTNLVTGSAGLGQTWKATSVNSGMAYVAVHRTYDAGLFSQGKPEFEFVLRGLREYDPRKDSTVVGGSGPQRLDNPATWTHTLNPAVHRLNYQLGLRALVSGRTLIGEGKSLGQLDLGSYFVAMNVCDSLRTDGKRTYQCSLFVTGEDDHTEILKEFDDAMAGYGLNRRGLSGVIAGAPQIPVLEITAEDLPIDRAKEVQFRKSAFDRYNHLSGQFLSIEANWNPESLTPVYVNADVAADGRNRQTSNDFLQVTDPDIAQYLLNIRYRQNRRGGTATVPVSRRVGLKVQEGEWVVWRGKEWMISEWVLDEQFRVTLKLSETGADIYDDEDIEPGPVVIPPAPVINPSMLSTVQDFNVEAGMISSAGRQDTPCLRFTWSPPEDPTITEVRIPYRKHGETLELLATCSEPESGLFLTTDGVVSETLYNARATITTVPDRLRTYTPWMTTVAPTGRMNVLDNSIVASKIATAAVIADKIQNEAVTSLKLADLAVTTAKIQIAAVTQDILANSSVIASKIADAAVGITKFASGIEPIGIIAGSTVPTTKTTEVITVDGKMYRWNGTAYTSAVPVADLDGQIISSQIGDLAITNPKLAALAVDASKIAANAITNTKIADDAISTPKLQANSIVGDKIAAKAITADKMILADLANYVENPTFSEGNVSWVSSGFTTIVNDPSLAFIGNYCMSINVGAVGIAVRSNNVWPVIPGQTFMMEVTARAVGAVNTTLNARLRFMLADGVTLVGAPVGVTFTSTDTAYVTRKSATLTVPAGAVYAWFDVNPTVAITTGGFRVGAVRVQRKNAAELIVDGTIITNMLAAGAITTNELAANAVTSAKIIAGAVSTTQLAAGAITADKLAVGTGSQWLENTDFAAGLTGWGIRAASSLLQYDAPSIRTDSWGVKPYGSIQIRCNTTAVVNQYCDIAPQNADGGIKFFTVEEGKRYQFSVYAVALRANRQLFIGWVNSAGSVISYSFSPSIAPEGVSPNFQLSGYIRTSMFGVAVAGAVSVVVFIRHAGTIAPGGDSYVWFTRAFFGEATDNQTEPSPWAQSGVTLIDAGNIVTGAVTTAKLDALAVTSAKIAAGAIVAGKISAGAIVAADIAAATITGAKIAADTIGVNNMAANSITAKSLILTDYENLVPNGYFDEFNTTTYWDIAGAGASIYPVAGFATTGVNVANLQKTILVNSVNAQLKSTYAIPVTGGEELYGETAIMTNSVTNTGAGFYYRINFYTAAMVFISGADFVVNAPITNVMTTRSGTVTTPSTARLALIQIFNHSSNSTGANLLIDRLVLRRKKAGELIVDGSITAAMINVTTLSAISATLGSVNISNAIIGTLTVGTSNIATGAVTSFGSGSIALGAMSGTKTVDFTVTHPDTASNPGVIVKVDGYMETTTQIGSPNGGFTLTLINLNTGGTLARTQTLVNTGASASLSLFAFFTPAAGLTTSTIRFQVDVRATVSFNSCFATAFKR